MANHSDTIETANRKIAAGDGEPTEDRKITREQFDELTTALLPLIKRSLDDSALHSFTVPVGPVTAVSVEFRGPTGQREYDNLIAQLTTFKTLIADDASERPLTFDDAKSILERAGNIVFAKRA